MQKALGILLILLCLAEVCVNAQENRQQPDSLKVSGKTLLKATALTSAYYATSMIVLGKTWYKGREVVPFHFYNDNKGYLQVDKFGHTFGAYVYSYIGYHYLVKSGFSRKEALYFGATLGLILQTPIEIMDGIYEGYGFSWGDMAANTMGSALVLGQELIFKEQVIKYKFSYRESNYAKKSNGYLGTSSFDRLFNDYNGHTYWLSMPVTKLIHYEKIPAWLNVAVGYGANGMFGEFENISEYNGVSIPETERYRQYLFSMDIDWTKIKTNSKFLKLLFTGMTFVKLPFPSIEYSSRGNIRWYWMYY